MQYIYWYLEQDIAKKRREEVEKNFQAWEPAVVKAWEWEDMVCLDYGEHCFVTSDKVPKILVRDWKKGIVKSDS